MSTVWVGSPNYTPGRGGRTVDKIVIHWMDGFLAGTDAQFGQYDSKKPYAGRSAHFGVEDGNEHQYVRVDDTAWHANNFAINQSSVAIEISANSEISKNGKVVLKARDASDRTYATVASRIADLWNYFPLIPRGRAGLHKHLEYSKTTCCGTVDLDRLARIALDIFAMRYGPHGDQSEDLAPTGVPASYNVPVLFKVKVNAPLGKANFRKEPTTASESKGAYPNGSEFWCADTVTGQHVSVKWEDGRTVSSDKWYKSEPDGLGNSYFISAAVAQHL